MNMPSWIEISLRTLAAIAIMFLLAKVLGKRQISQLSFFEYVTGITIGSIAADISIDLEGSWFEGIIALIVWALVAAGIEFMQLKSKKVRDLVDGKATVLVKDGKVLEDNLKKERITVDEFMQQLRKRNVFNIADVEFAIIEPSGDINVLLTQENLPLTPKSLGIKVPKEREPQLVISDGQILDEALATRGFSRQWLHTELNKIGVTVENVVAGQVDSYGELFVDLYDDQIQVPPPQERASLLAMLKKCEADIELFGLSTKDEEGQKMYEQCSKQLQKVITNVKPYLI